MNLKKLALLAIAVVVMCGMIGAGTFAYFTSSANVEPTTFTSGSLDMALSNDSVFGSSDDVTATWVSPSNWAPGQKTSATLHFTNVGSVDAHHIYFMLNNASNNGNGDATKLMDKIIISNLQERFNGTTTSNQALKVAHQVGNRDDVLTLAEFLGQANNWFGFYTYDDVSGDGNVIAAGDQQDYDLIMEFTFDPSADNTYQGDSCQFALASKATQNSPTDGMVCLHQAE